MTVVSVAIVISFHLKSQPSRLELRMARESGAETFLAALQFNESRMLTRRFWCLGPLGIIFWLLSLACLALGFGNYIKTVNKYSRRAAIVQTGWKTQSVCSSYSLDDAEPVTAE